MLCQDCRKNPASVFITRIENGRQKRYRLCEKCAARSPECSIKIQGLHEGFFSSISDMLAGFSDAEKIDAPGGSLRCPGCGTTLSSFQQSGLLGCDRCYETFAENLTSLMMRVHGSVQHSGKVPPGVEKKTEIDKLRLELREAVDREEYERAAVIRDRIKSMEKHPDEPE